VPLTRFRHPARALYLLGAEDHGLPPEVLERCHYVVQIPTPAPWSLNVSVAGSLVMHDRYLKTTS
jgi:tRNA G18 (ribose-2'-O)-methylase SpoU